MARDPAYAKYFNINPTTGRATLPGGFAKFATRNLLDVGRAAKGDYSELNAHLQAGKITPDRLREVMLPEQKEFAEAALTSGAIKPYMQASQAPFASGGYMPGGIAMLAKGRFLKGNGDGVSDSIPARFAGSGQEARLADGEFVVPARVVSELGNGSSDAGARKLYAMLDRVEARAKKAKRGKPSGADRELNKLA